LIFLSLKKHIALIVFSIDLSFEMSVTTEIVIILQIIIFL